MSETVNLNITDISDAVKVIDHASEQGAFRGWDTIRQVLALRDRLDLFVGAAATIVAEPEPEPDAPSDVVAPELPPLPVGNTRRHRPRVAERGV